VNILPNTEDWADNTTALSGMSGEELQAAVTSRNRAQQKTYSVYQSTAEYRPVFSISNIRGDVYLEPGVLETEVE
jgi:hypothetical protein